MLYPDHLKHNGNKSELEIEDFLKHLSFLVVQLKHHSHYSPRAFMMHWSSNTKDIIDTKLKYFHCELRAL